MIAKFGSLRPDFILVLTIALANQSVPIPILVLSIALGTALAWLSFVDLKTYRLPNPVTLTLTAVGLAVTYVLNTADLLAHTLAAVGSFAFLAGANFIYRAIRGHDGIGGGDAKLLAAAGAWTGPEGALAVLLLSTLFALAAFATSALLGRMPKPQTRLPFGPFLGLAFWITWLFGPLQ